METRWVECNCLRLFTSLAQKLYIQILCVIIPNKNMAIRCRNDELLSKTNIHTSYNCRVEQCMKRLQFWLFGPFNLTVIRKFYCEQLIVTVYNIDLVFWFTKT